MWTKEYNYRQELLTINNWYGHSMCCTTQYPQTYISKIRERSATESLTAYNIILQNIPILKWEREMNLIFQTHVIRKSERQPKFMKSFLTQFQAHSTIAVKPTGTKWGKPNCGICVNLIKEKEFSFKRG